MLPLRVLPKVELRMCKWQRRHSVLKVFVYAYLDSFFIAWSGFV